MVLNEKKRQDLKGLTFLKSTLGFLNKVNNGALMTMMQ